MAKISKLMKIEWQGVCKDYTSVEVSQDLDLGHCRTETANVLGTAGQAILSIRSQATLQDFHTIT